MAEKGRWEQWDSDNACPSAVGSVIGDDGMAATVFVSMDWKLCDLN
jgi:hypothetical protein